MGYAMFAARKIMLTDSINMTNLELTKISNQLMDLADLGAAVSDGEISAFDIAEAQNAGLTCSYGWDLATANLNGKGAVTWAVAEKEALENIGASWGANIGGAAAGAGIAALLMGSNPVGWVIALAAGVGGFIGNKLSGKTKAREQYVQERMNASKEADQEKIARELQEQIAKMENELEKRQATLETKIQAYQQDLQAVEQAESKGIESATPKYAGV
ncbi:MAG: hypothetical protein IJY61_05205 [Candidatus Gastranaerophilales bacterium]|nr:hypothetical protein [Candidatus Gastranaerophilales bacterium]